MKNLSNSICIMNILVSVALLLLIVTTAQPDHYILASDGDTVECIDRNKQPAFKNYLLRNHKNQETPSEYPITKKVQKKSIWPTSEAQISTAKCEIGTVPIRQKGATSNHQRTPETGTNSTFAPQHEYAEASVHAPPKLYGTRATINLWNPLVEDSATELSISQIWLSSGDFDTHDLNTIEVGWQVCPSLYNDSKTRFFIYWTSDGYNRTGGYNLEEPGFIQISNSIVLGDSITPISSSGGSQYEMTILVWKDRNSGNWWLCLNNELVGYWPAELFTSLADHAESIEWGGEIVNSQSFGRHTKTQMGSGHFPDEGFGKSSYFRNLEVVYDNNSLQSIQNLKSITTNPECYKIKDLRTREWDTHFFFGGPGFGHADSGAVSSALRFSLFYILLSLFAIIV
ncbi:hypothetical protein Bca52824_003416 [Brassica carinata]|uniref:Neprosin PEP catalytic domain-containing protein n=1 Tax=Brassica carinata TaxID=52824 RepID=A0A8X7WL37_BRACI|nr:hypothetical protein Bca52824_003416 [Brassica carinata]